jgi:rhomboid protease GluP
VIRHLPLTFALLASLVLVFAAELYVAQTCCGTAAMTETLIGTPSEEVLMRSGALVTQRGIETKWWTLFTSMFVHIGVLHLALNGMALAQLGYLLEGLFGRRAMAISFFASGVAAAVASHIEVIDDPRLSVYAGASGAIFGLLGTLIVALRRSRSDGWSHNLSRRLLGCATFNVVIGVAFAAIAAWLGSEYTVANGAHLAGLASGALIGWLPLRIRERPFSSALVNRLSGARSVPRDT